MTLAQQLHNSLFHKTGFDPACPVCSPPSMVVKSLKAIASLGGNLSDDRLTEKTGANDVVHRGLIYTEARRIAREAIKAAEADAADRAVMLWALQQIISDLPTRRDWLDPDLERICREVIAKALGTANGTLAAISGTPEVKR